jgi:hypothetical protein
MEKTHNFVNQEIGFATAIKKVRKKWDPRNPDLPIIIPLSQKTVELKGFITKDSNDILFMDNYNSFELVMAEIILSIRSHIPKGLEGKTLTTTVCCPGCFDKNGQPFEYEMYIPQVEIMRKLIQKNEPLNPQCPNCNNSEVLLDSRTLFPINLQG